MNFNEILNTSFNLWKVGKENDIRPTTVFIQGPPGLGKTAIANELATKIQREFSGKTITHIVDLTSSAPEDLGGMPYISGSQTRYAPQQWMSDFQDSDTAGVLVLDDLPAALPSSAVAARQIALTGSINGIKLSNNVIVLVTGNRQSDKAAARTLPSHFLNAVAVLEMQADLDSWSSWFLKNEGSPTVLAFLRTRPNLFSQLPSEASETGSFATPRSWAGLSRNYRYLRESPKRLEAFSSFVGTGAGVEFLSYIDDFEKLPSIEAFYEDPTTIIPNPGETLANPGRKYAVALALTYIAAKDESEHAVLKLLRAAKWAFREDKEMVSIIFSTWQTLGKGSVELIRALSYLKKADPQYSQFLLEMQKAFE